MHGIARIRQTQEAIEARRRKEREKIEQYLKLTDDIVHRKRSRDWSQEAFGLTTEMLNWNPEFYTVWNYRREILSNGRFPNSTPAEIMSLITSDLNLTSAALRKYPKVYWIWNHRRWCLENIPDGPSSSPQTQDQDTQKEPLDPIGWKRTSWDKELYVVEKMLDADPRNFHAWDYRRYILSTSPIIRLPNEELGYTTKKIESNFSNFSAWHQRSKIFTSLWDQESPEQVKRRKNEEFEFVRNALYTDPNDQSGWLYHRWLIGPGHDKAVLEREIAVIEELFEIESNSKWCLESLVHYKGLVLQSPEMQDPVTRTQLKQDCVTYLATLESIDPQRKQRYRELLKYLD